MIVSDRRSWFGKMIVSDRRSRKKVSSLTLPTCLVGLELPKPYPIGVPGTNMTSVIFTMRLGTFSEVKILSSTMYVYYSYANDTKFSEEGMNIILG